MKKIEKMIIRETSRKDFPGINNLLKQVGLPVEGVLEHIDNFLVMYSGDDIKGVVGLEVYGYKGLLRSLSVVPEIQGKGFGNKLYYAILKKAEQLQLNAIILLTETAEKFFRERGFEKVDRNIVDEEIKESVEFKSVCPLSATCMRKKL